MSVIINDFEVVAEPPPAKERGGGDEHSQAGEGAQAQGPTPHEIERVIKHELARFTRLWAH